MTLCHPALLDGALDVALDQVRIGGEVGELQATGLEADHCAGGCSGFELLGEVVDAAGGQTGGLDAVERRRVPAFLDVAEDGLAGIPEAGALLLEQRADESGAVDGVGVLAADDEPESLAGAEP